MKRTRMMAVPLLIVAIVGLIACGGNGGTNNIKTESIPQTPDNNPEVLAKTFADCMQIKDYEKAVMLFAEFSEEPHSIVEVAYKVRLLDVGNIYSMSNSPAEIKVIENNGNTCHIITIVEIYGHPIDCHLYLKKINDCWRIDKYEL